MVNTKQGFFQEIPVITDDRSWIWLFIVRVLRKQRIRFVKVGTHVSLAECWSRFSQSERIIVHWEGKKRPGGSVVEEILRIQPDFDVANRLIVVTTNPVHEDVVYFSELGLSRLLKIRQRDREMAKIGEELIDHLRNPISLSAVEKAWKKVQEVLDGLAKPAAPEVIQALQQKIAELSPQSAGKTSRGLDCEASLAFLKGEPSRAQQLWSRAIELNPNYLRPYANLAKFYRETGDFKRAFALLEKMHQLNRSHVGRLVQMGEVKVSMRDDLKAEHFFKQALRRDVHCSEALNGLAEIRFRQGELEETKKLLARSKVTVKIASELNRQGIDLVRQERYQDALEHYRNAHYVLPDQSKGPMLFYNMALCYSKWGRPELATRYLEISLIKDPKYEKAKRLYNVLMQQQTEVSAPIAS